jgi:hypothetical protein
MFPYEVQFGHAGALANSAAQTADAKNAYDDVVVTVTSAALICVGVCLFLATPSLQCIESSRCNCSQELQRLCGMHSHGIQSFGGQWHHRVAA